MGRGNLFHSFLGVTIYKKSLLFLKNSLRSPLAITTTAGSGLYSSMEITLVQMEEPEGLTVAHLFS